MRSSGSSTSLIIAAGTVLMSEFHTTHSLLGTTISTVFPKAQHFVSKEHVRFDFSSSHPPVVRVDPGDLVHVETNDCFYGKIQPDTLSSWEHQQKAGAKKKNSHRAPKNEANRKNENSRGGTYVNGSILDDLPWSQRNPITGPIYVNGARPGDILAVTIVDIRPKGIGVACCGSWGGQLACWMTKDSATLRFFDMSQCGRIVTMRDLEEEGTTKSHVKINNNEKIKENKKGTSSLRCGFMVPPFKNKRLGPIAFPASPMLGVVGVAPEKGPIGTVPAGKHGGNLDNTANGIGSTIYLPIHHPGGLLSMGDMHASQGDGEIAGSGVEIGGDVLLKCRVLKHEDLYGCSHNESKEDNNNNNNNHRHNKRNSAATRKNAGFPWKLEYPVTETPTHWITHGVVVGNIPKTTSIACQEAAKILIGQWGFSPEEAFIFLSVRGDLGLCQACHPDKGTQIAKMAVPRLDHLCPRAFKVLAPSAES